MIRRLGIMALLPLGLSACADMALLQRPDVPAQTGAADPVGQVPTEDPSAGRIAWGLDGDAEQAQTTLASPPVPRRKPNQSQAVAVADPDPDLLVGLDFEATKALLGDPALKMEQPPAKIWAYNGGSCMFSVFFYPSMDDSVFRVLTYEVTGNELELPIQTASRTGNTGAAIIGDGANPVLRRCFADLLHEREIPDAG